ncbi:glycosyltransferase [Hwanghaeella grinnelliae]|uniref:Glycosyltransferase n=1 Tax=Hwanghaeella grinnelliae TaxID=2500179 RepID=A0A437QP97_9PROT|nr:glycosyltransferase family 4 protein [Hwanghaeella grinnelliae]RVU36267.1 glycosyltransferase [Hwanghaeella grinnelliae]
MWIEFYAPMKAPTHPVPSGDRRMARLLMQVLAQGGHKVTLASSTRCWEGKGDAAAQAAIWERAALERSDLASWYERHGAPDLWFTYHLYHKAPDLIGPDLCDMFAIPYCVAEPSFAPKQEEGPWATGHAAVRKALARADAAFFLNPTDRDCVIPLLSTRCQAVDLPPFVDTAPYSAAAAAREETRARIAKAHGLDMDRPWLLAAAMMRQDVKKESYRLLADALGRVDTPDWSLVVVGDGPAREEVEAMFTGIPKSDFGQTAFLGSLSAEDLARVQAACDLAVWPSLNEAFGLGVLEAQAAGLPVVSGGNPGVANMIIDGRTGLLTEMGDAKAFAEAVAYYLRNPEARRMMGLAAAANVSCRHDMNHAQRVLFSIINTIMEEYRR